MSPQDAYPTGCRIYRVYDANGDVVEHCESCKPSTGEVIILTDFDPYEGFKTRRKEYRPAPLQVVSVGRGP